MLKPNIEKLLFKDFMFFYWISKCFELFIPKVRRLKLSKNVEVLSEISLNELRMNSYFSRYVYLSKGSSEFSKNIWSPEQAPGPKRFLVPMAL